MNNEMYKCCRWCHYYEQGKCYKNNVTMDSNDVYRVAESGKLSEVIKSTLEETKKSPFRELEILLQEYKVSNKRIKEFREKFEECFEEYNLDLSEQLDEKVSNLYQSELENTTTSGVEIINPETFCCKEWC